MASFTATPPLAEANVLEHRLQFLYQRRSVVDTLIQNMETYQSIERSALQRRPMGRGGQAAAMARFGS